MSKVQDSLYRGRPCNYAPSLLGDLTALSLVANAASITLAQIESVNRILNASQPRTGERLDALVAHLNDGARIS
jgi:hypothetical protein